MLLRRAIAFLIDVSLIAIIANSMHVFNMDNDNKLSNEEILMHMVCVPEGHSTWDIRLDPPCLYGASDTKYPKLLAFLGYVIYASIFVYFFSGTIGNRLMGLKVCAIQRVSLDYSYDGRQLYGFYVRPNVYQAFIRAFSVLLVGFNACFLVFFDFSGASGYRSLIDRISKTVVMCKNQ